MPGFPVLHRISQISVPNTVSSFRESFRVRCLFLQSLSQPGQNLCAIALELGTGTMATHSHVTFVLYRRVLGGESSLCIDSPGVEPLLHKPAG